MEIDFLNYLENHNKTKAIIHRVHKVFDLITGDSPIKYSERIPALSIQESSIIENYDEAFFNLDNTLMFSFDDKYYKFISIDTGSIDEYSPSMRTCAYKHFSTKTNTLMNDRIYMLKSNYFTNDQDDFILLMHLITEELIRVFAKSEFDIDLSTADSTACPSNISQFRYSIDFMIIVFRILDGIFDLKYSDFDNINRTLTIPAYEDAYKYAITKDASIEDYENMIRESLKKQLKTVDLNEIDTEEDNVITDPEQEVSE